MKTFPALSFFLWLTALVLVVFTFSKLPLSEIGSSISALTGWQWLGWILVNLLIISLGNLRWFLLNKAIGFRVRFLRLLAIRQAGQTVSFITPGPQFGGEPLQIYWLSYYEKIEAGKAGAALGMDRYCELLVNFSVLLTGVVLLALSSSTATGDWIKVIVALTVMITCVVIFGWMLVRQPGWIGRLFSRITRRSPHLKKLHSQAQAFGNHLKKVSIFGSTGWATALLLSTLGWIGIVCELWMLLEFLDLPVTLNSLVLILVALRLAMLLPIPGGIGTIEAAALWSFSMLFFPPVAALGLITLMRVRDFAVLCGGLGAWLTIRSSRSLKIASDTPPST